MGMVEWKDEYSVEIQVECQHVRLTEKTQNDVAHKLFLRIHFGFNTSVGFTPVANQIPGQP